MKNLIRALAAVPVLCALPLTSMANTAVMSVTGSITPATCTPSLSNEGRVNHGNINPATLLPTEFNTLQRQTVDLLILCDAPASLAVYLRDNRSGSVPEGIEATLNAPATAMMGLGAVDGQNIGAYKLTFDSAGADMSPISRTTSSGPWARISAAEILVDPTSDQQYSWTRSDRTEPGTYLTLNARMTLHTALNRANDLPSLSSDVTLDGSATLTLFHL